MLLIVAVAVFALVIYPLWRLYQQRSLFKGLPGPPHHAIWGHFLIMRDMAANLPPNTAPHLLTNLMREKYGLGDFFYLDLWPLAPPQLVIVHSELAAHVTQKLNLPKQSGMIRQWTSHILGPKSIVTSNGHDWLVARKSFSPGFQPRKILQRVPDTVDDVLEFCEVLKQHATSGKSFEMVEVGARMVFNVSAKVILRNNCGSQWEEDEFLELFKKQVSFCPQDFWSRYLYDISPRRNYQKWKNGKALDRYVGRVIDERAANPPGVDEKGVSLPFHAIDDAITWNREQNGSKDPRAPLDKETRDMLITSIKTLIFAGHDTSASTLCYIYAALINHPEALHKLRMEHDHVFGKDPAAAAQLLREDPNLLNSIPYTLAVVKEVLRLWPPTGLSPREGNPNQTIATPDGNFYPTYPFVVMINNFAIMHREELFKDADRFYPERHLVTDPEDPYFVPRNSWRPFEKGVRTCLGQTLALMQLKITIVLTIRSFDFELAYEDGRFMYQLLDLTAKPSEGLPTRVRMRTNGY